MSLRPHQGVSSQRVDDEDDQSNGAVVRADDAHLVPDAHHESTRGEDGRENEEDVRSHDELAVHHERQEKRKSERPLGEELSEDRRDRDDRLLAWRRTSR